MKRNIMIAPIGVDSVHKLRFRVYAELLLHYQL